MATAAPEDAVNRKSFEPAWREFARAPLVPIALAATVGVIADRLGPVPMPVSLFTAVLGLVGWCVVRQRSPESSLAWLWLATAAIACVHHHAHRHLFAESDIGAFATERPAPAKLRGVLAEEPVLYPRKPDPLATIPRPDSSATVLEVTSIESAGGWVPASGRVRVTVDGELRGLHRGDVVEVVGLLSLPRSPANPGEADYRARLLDSRITAELRSRRSADGVTRLEEGWRASAFGWLAALRGWGTRTLRESLPPREAAIAAALLLGETSAMDRSEWEAYIRTGVVHVLAISGQHLAVLAGFIWIVLKAARVRRRQAAWIVAITMIAYALLTGARPSAMRAAVMVCVICGGFVLRRPANPANAFALAWLAIIALNPTDPFNVGCQLSFLSVFVLIWGASRWLEPRERTPVEQLLEEARSVPMKVAFAIGRTIRIAFAISLILGLVNAPLVLAAQNIVAPVGILLGPPMILLTSIALIAGFLLLLASPFSSWLAWPFAFVTHWSLAGCEWLVQMAAQLPGAWVYAPGPSSWWLIGFYFTLAGVVLCTGRVRMAFVAGLSAWVLGGLLLPTSPRPAEELRITFLAVGDGGCIVMEAADGRVFLYDAGTITGPDVVRRTVAPFLWHRGIRRIDEVFLSHADLDHYNGLPALLERFPVGQVTLTPSFHEKPNPGVRETLAALDRYRVPIRIAKAGDHFDAGSLQLEVLHPPELGPTGNENARSLVLLIRHEGHTVLLTGDLEGNGQTLVRERSLPAIDVMLAPHHGAVNANAGGRTHEGVRQPGAMAVWAKPRFVISSQGPDPVGHLVDSYGAVGATVWDTATYGAITVRSHPTGLTAEAFRSGEVLVLRRGR